jgi:hypothetical protein
MTSSRIACCYSRLLNSRPCQFLTKAPPPAARRKSPRKVTAEATPRLLQPMKR